jgi:hypothetical protein
LLPSVYDALLVIRPSCNFRDGRVIKNDSLWSPWNPEYVVELPFNDGYLFGLIHLCCANYRSTYHGTFYSWMISWHHSLPLSSKRKNTLPPTPPTPSQQERRPIEEHIMLGFAPVFLFIKSYASCFVAELSQLCYKGVFRTIALGSTGGTCTFSCRMVLILQPVIVPVGRIALGRILNVVGSCIDPYIPLCLSSQFLSYHLISSLVASTSYVPLPLRPFPIQALVGPSLESYPPSYRNHRIPSASPTRDKSSRSKPYSFVLMMIHFYLAYSCQALLPTRARAAKGFRHLSSKL